MIAHSTNAKHQQDEHKRLFPRAQASKVAPELGKMDVHREGEMAGLKIPHQRRLPWERKGKLYVEMLQL